jgi:RNA polymerase sigma-70 factor (ECF subfamily)
VSGEEENEVKRAFIDGLVASHGASLERFLQRKLESSADAAELAQEAYLRLYRLEHPEQLDNARAFLFQVAANLAVDQLRRRSLHYRFLRNEQAQQSGGEPADINGSSASPEEILDAREKLARIYQAVERLPERCRQAFLLHRVSGLSYSDIARELGVSVSSVEKYILQALKHCREELADYYGEGESKRR